MLALIGSWYGTATWVLREICRALQKSKFIYFIYFMKPYTNILSTDVKQKYEINCQRLPCLQIVHTKMEGGVTTCSNSTILNLLITWVGKQIEEVQGRMQDSFLGGANFKKMRVRGVTPRKLITFWSIWAICKLYYGNFGQFSLFCYFFPFFSLGFFQIGFFFLGGGCCTPSAYVPEEVLKLISALYRL